MKALSTAIPDSPMQPAPALSAVMSVADACEFLAVSRNTLYKLIAEGEIPAFRLTTGGRWKFRRGELEEWLSDRQARSTR